MGCFAWETESLKNKSWNFIPVYLVAFLSIAISLSFRYSLHSLNWTHD